MVCQWGIGWNKNSKKLIDMDCPWSCNVVHGATRGGGLRKNMIGETPCSHFRNSVSTDVCDSHIHYLAVIVSWKFSNIVACGNKQCGVKPKGVF